ncbi:protein casc1-like [Plakobranchus ocellatus]|uniref:Protein casc1-like n=1 Tax=Plakobranchus ocellatus TaxID=259542 RepID=A0AAV4A3N3_9GAST|nr:protein casc1-like [Plakobranchus ocellatus]
MSKADKERLKKEEQERKQQEEEAARLLALEEVKKQQKEEAEMAVERTKIENEERKCRKRDMEELVQIIEQNKEQLNQLNEERRQQAKWSRYMRCDGSPDPVNQGEINTYINLRLEDDTRNDAESVLKDSQLDLSLIAELQYLMTDTPKEQLSEKDIDMYHETICELEKLVCSKLDLATLQILCDATKLADSETGNLQHVVRSPDVALCVWGNLMKNPRVKSFEFSDLHFTFDIPRVLGLSDCAVRVLMTKFDHFSPTSKAAIPRRKKKEEVVEEAPAEEEGKKEGEEENEEKQDEEKKEEGEGEEKEETELDLMAALRGDTEGEQEEEVKEEEEVLEEDYEDPPTPEPPEYEDFDEEDDIIDLRANDVLGGIYQVNLLHMPPQPKTVGSWTITTLVDPPAIQPMEYSADPVANTEGQDKNKDKKDEKPAIAISMSLPDDVLFLEEPQVARWDEKRKFWSTNGFSDLNYNEDARTFSFKTTHFGTICLLQDTHINMPFQSWELRPHKLDSAVLTIIAAIVEIEIEIKDALCCLSQPKDKPELESIRGKWVTPAELIKMMKSAGVNVFPNEDSSKFVSIQNKHPLIEDRMYQQMALTASAMAYSWSKWNNEREREEVIFQAAEALEDEPLLEEDWSVFLATKRRVMKLKMTEFDDEFSSAPTGDVFKSNIYHLMTEVASEAALNRVKETNFQFVDCVEQLLRATKVLTYA